MINHLSLSIVTSHKNNKLTFRHIDHLPSVVTQIMKLFLLKSTILALVHTSSYAFDAPFFRGSAEDACQTGTQAGVNSVNTLWASPTFDSDCDNIWNLPSSADAMKDNLYPLNTGNWKVDAYNGCARDYGVDPRVAEIEEQCLGNDPDQCIELGETAASIIVYANVCDGYSATNHQDYLQTCRDVAYGICEGSSDQKIKEQCIPNWPVSTGKLSQLMGMCEDQVNSMVPITTAIPTFMPTKKPSGNRDGRNECSSGGPYDIGSFCYIARQQCCSSVKKYDQWQTFCEYYGLPYPGGELSQGIIPWTFLSNDVDCTMCGSSQCASGDAELDVEGIEYELDGVENSNGEDSADFEDEDMEDAGEADVTDHSNDIVSPQ